MSLTVVDTRVDGESSTESVVTITVQITVAGDELPPAASRLITDLEALLGTSVTQSTRPPAPVIPTQKLRLVEPPAPRVRRAGGHAEVAVPALYLCTGPRLVLRDGAPVHLTRREFDLLRFLCEHPRRVFSRAQLLQQVWGYDMVGTERTVDVHVRRLRVKLGDAAAVIATVRGVGYRLDDDTPVAIVVQPD